MESLMGLVASSGEEGDMGRGAGAFAKEGLRRPKGSALVESLTGSGWLFLPLTMRVFGENRPHVLDRVVMA